jgi:hypothetical protein
MKNHNEKTETTYWEGMSESQEEDLIQENLDMIRDQEGIARVLGENHPLVELIQKALKIGDPEELAVAKAAYEALPEEFIHRVHHPWIGHPPPSGTREKLRNEHAPKLVGEDMPGPDPVGCYLRIDAKESYQEEIHWTADEDGHVLDPAIVHDLRHVGWPVRVQVAEGSDKGLALELLKKICGLLERDWDNLTDPARYFREPEDEDLPF